MLQTQQIQRQIVELELQAVQLAAFRPTPEDIAILTKIVESGGTVKAETIPTNATQRKAVHELRELGLVNWYGDAGCLLRGFEITRQGRAMLEANRTKTPEKPPGQPGHSKNKIPPDDVQEINRMMNLKLWKGKPPIEVCRAYLRRIHKNVSEAFIETQAQSLKRKRNRY